MDDSIESKMRANIWQELGKVVESSVTVASENALPDLINHSAESGAGPSSSPTSKFTSKKTKKLRKPRAPDLVRPSFNVVTLQYLYVIGTSLRSNEEAEIVSTACHAETQWTVRMPRRSSDLVNCDAWSPDPGSTQMPIPYHRIKLKWWGLPASCECTGPNPVYKVWTTEGRLSRFGQYGRTEDAASVKGKAEVWLHLLDY
ncbi:hypothetical protein EDD15DRAFT_2203768 [Pisolithus albus]|nr:hypothetical protein EDD15DRAFT_2203768 [Pisolithus albus]